MSIALVGITQTGVVIVSVNQVVTLDIHVAAVIDTVLLIARSVLAVLYSQVIHMLRTDEADTQAPAAIPLETIVAETINGVLADSLVLLSQHLEASLSQALEE